MVKPPAAAAALLLLLLLPLVPQGAALQAELEQGHAYVEAVAGLAEVGGPRVCVHLGVDLRCKRACGCMYVCSVGFRGRWRRGGEENDGADVAGQAPHLRTKNTSSSKSASFL